MRDVQAPDPVVRSLALAYGIAKSSAWHLVQRVLRWNDGHRPVSAERAEEVQIGLRMPRKRMVASAPPGIVALDAARATEVGVRLNIAGDRAWRDVIGVEASEPHAHPACAWLEDQLRSRGNVSLRWLPRWIDGLLRLLDPRESPPWADVVRRLSPVPLLQLDPWLG